MGIFNRKNKEAKPKETDKKSVKVDNAAARSERVKKEEKKEKSMKELYSDGKAVAAEEQKDKEAKKPGGRKKYANAYKVLVKPLVTEKAATLGAENKYLFVVANKANKIEVAKAVDEVYGIKPVSVNIIKVRGKKVRYGRIKGVRKNWKKAIISLPAGKSINIYEGV